MSSPIGKDPGKELCDFLVVCDRHVIVISVKDIKLAAEVDETAIARWRRSAIESSAKQIYGAERFLASVSEVRDKSGRMMKLPDVGERQLHRICVAFGARRELPIEIGDPGKGFIHVMDEGGFPIVMRELDTIADLVEYLSAKEGLVESGPRIVCAGEENLLGFFLRNGRTFPTQHDFAVLDDTIWPGLLADSSYQAKVQANRLSYAWDNVIEYVANDLLAGKLLYAHPVTETERILRVMAKETRFARRTLATAMTEVFTTGKIRSRMMRADSGIVYVFLAMKREEDRKFRQAELGLRCHIARSHFRDDARVVVGIASERADDGKPGLSFDLFMLDFPTWSPESEALAEKARQELGLFRDPIVQHRQSDEYPTT